VGWTRRFVLFHGKRHPADMGAPEVNALLSHLAVEGRVSASTQAQALSALVFLYRQVLGDPLVWIDNLVRAERRRKLPVVLTRDEVRALLAAMRGTPRR
jgi:integrase